MHRDSTSILHYYLYQNVMDSKLHPRQSNRILRLYIETAPVNFLPGLLELGTQLDIIINNACPKFHEKINGHGMAGSGLLLYDLTI